MGSNCVSRRRTTPEPDSIIIRMNTRYEAGESAVLPALSRPHPQHIQCKINVIWVHFTHALLRKIPLGVLREVCDYIRGPPLLPLLWCDWGGSELYFISFYDFSANNWGPRTILNSTIALDNQSRWTMIDSERVFVSGGCGKK